MLAKLIGNNNQRTVVYEEDFTLNPGYVKLNPVKLAEVGVDITGGQPMYILLHGRGGKKIPGTVLSDESCDYDHIKIEHYTRRFLLLNRPYDKIIIKHITPFEFRAISEDMTAMLH
jgi:hypothetical protein